MTPEIMNLPAGLDPSMFTMNADGKTVSYKPYFDAQDLNANNLKIPLGYFSSPMYQQDMARYGRIMGPGGMFKGGDDLRNPQMFWNADGTPNMGLRGYGLQGPIYGGPQDFAPGSDQGVIFPVGVDQESFVHDDFTGKYGLSKQATAELTNAHAVYDAMLNGGSSTTDFTQAGKPPQQLGLDVLGGLSSGGYWIAPGSDTSQRNRAIEARITSNGEIMVTDPRGGDGNNPVYYYDQNGKFTHREVGAKPQSAISGVASVALAGLGFSALGAGAAGAGAAGSGAGGGAAAGGGLSAAETAAAMEQFSAEAMAAYGGEAAGTLSQAAGIAQMGGNAIEFLSSVAPELIPQFTASFPGAAGGGSGGALEGVPPPANPNALPQGVPPPANPNVVGSGLTNPITGAPISTKDLLGAGASLLGGLSGGAGGGAGGSGSGGAGGVLDARMEPYLYGATGLMPRTQGLLDSQMPQAQAQSAQMAQVGTGLLNQPIAGNGFTSGAVKLNAPTTPTNPYLQQAMDSLGRTNGELLAKGLQGIRGNSAGVGGLGGSRQGVAEAGAIDSATKNLMDAGTNLYYNAYNQDQNRALQQYGQDQAFYGQQRSQDQSGAQLGGSLLGQSQTQAWAPLTNASGIYKPYTGLASSSSGDSGFNWQGAVGGLLAGASLAGKLGFWS